MIALAVARAWELRRAEERVQQAQALQLVKVAARTLDGTIAETQTLLVSVSKFLDPTAPAERNDIALQALFKSAPVRYANIWILDTLGRNIGAARLPKGGRLSFNLGDRRYFKTVMRTKRFVVGEVVKSRTLPGAPLILTFVLPILAEGTQTVRAILGASIEIDSLEAVRATRTLPAGSVMTVLDSTGEVAFRSLDAERWIGRKFPSAALLRNFAKGEGVGATQSADGTFRLSSFKGTERVKWMVYIGIPAQYTVDIVRNQFFRDLALGALITALFLLMSYFFTLRIVSPIESLTSDSRAIASGDMSRRSTLSTQDELGDLARAFNQMADTVVERNAALRTSQEQLLHAQKMDALGSFAGGIAHDFNNYLSAIIGHAELAQMTLPKGEPASEDIKEVLASAGRAADLTRQILVFSRKQVVEPQMLEMNDVLHGIERMLRRVLGDARQLELSYNAAPLSVFVDHGQLEQVLVNLVANARDATEDGGVVHISTAIVTRQQHDLSAAQSAPTAYAQLTVRDNGAGMSPRVRDRIFDPFFSTKDRGHGTGLGLAIAYGIIEQSGGTISVESTPGVGSAFNVLLPLRTEPLDSPVRSRATLDGDVPTGSGRILLAEDDEAVRTSTTRMLVHAGYTVTVAENGSAALQTLRETAEPFDLLLTDVVMPGMSGAELARRVRALQPHISVLFMSGYADDESVLKAVATYAAACLAKPFTAKTLAMFVSGALAGKVHAMPESSQRVISPRL
jgi:signal transduction histidine kinase/CheY-like chemotaxis protein